MEFRRHRDEYRAFVFALARRVVEVAETYALPPSSLTELDLDAVPNAFSQPTSTQTLVPARLNDVFDQAPRLRRPILSLSLDTSIDRG